MTSGVVSRKFQKAIKQSVKFGQVPATELQMCCDEFGRLIDKRNALIHAHPITDSDGSQVLAYQANLTKPLPDMKWPKGEVEALIQEFDDAACRAGVIFERLRNQVL